MPWYTFGGGAPWSSNIMELRFAWNIWLLTNMTFLRGFRKNGDEPVNILLLDLDYVHNNYPQFSPSVSYAVASIQLNYNSNIFFILDFAYHWPKKVVSRLHYEQFTTFLVKLAVFDWFISKHKRF